MKNVILKRYPIGNKRFVWKQKDYTLSSFKCNADDMDAAIKNLKEAGFNMLEMGWMPHDKAFIAVEKCEKYGIDVLFQDFAIMGGMQERYVDRKVDESVCKELTEKLKDKKHLLGYYVWDEPFRDNELKEARNQADMLEKYAPDALLFTVAIPSYNLDFTWENGKFKEYLERYVNVIDPPVLSLDFYPVGLDGYKEENELDDSLMWCDLGLMRKLCEKYDLPMWFYYQGCPVYDENVHYTTSMTDAMIFSSLIYGVKGLQYYSAVANSVIDSLGNKAQYFENQQKTHKKLSAWGNTLMALKSKLVYHSAELLPDCKYMNGLVDSVKDSEIILGPLPHRTSVGELADDYGNKYVIFVNRAFFKELKTTLKLKGKFNVYKISEVDGTQSLIAENVDSVDVSLSAGDASFLRFQNAQEEQYTIKYSLVE